MLSLLSLIIDLIIMILGRDYGYTDLFANATVIIFTFSFVFDITHSKMYRRYSGPIISGLILRVLLLYYDVYSNDPFHLPLVGGPLTSDPLRFYNGALAFMDGSTDDYVGLFSQLFGTIFSLTGPSRLLGEFIVLLFSIGTIMALASILDCFDVEQTQRTKGMYLICLLPNYAFLSIIFRRETIISFFIAISIHYFIKWFANDGGNKSYALSIIYALVASLFHGATGMIVLSYLFVRLLYSPKNKRYMLDYRNVAGALFFVFIVMFIYVRFGSIFFEKVTRKLGRGALSSVRDAGGSSYAKYVGDANNPMRMILFAIPRFMYYLFSPFPWQWRGMGDVITYLLSSCVYFMIMLNSVRYIQLAKKNDENRLLLIALFIIAVIITSVFSWGVTNTGTATRHRDKFIALFITMYVLSNKAGLRIKRRI